MNKYRFKKAIAFIFFGIAIAALLSFVVMCLWNGVLTGVLGVKTLSFWQALGILVLSKILFGGFHKHCGHGRHPWEHTMKEKWGAMTPEEKEAFKQRLRNRCGMWKRNGSGEKQEGNQSAE